MSIDFRRSNRSNHNLSTSQNQSYESHNSIESVGGHTLKKLQIDIILDESGYTWHLIKLALIIIMILTMEGLHMAFLGILIIPLKEYYKVSTTQMTIATSFFWLLLIFGSWFLLFLLKKWDRTQILKLSLVCVFTTNFFLACSNSFITFTIYLALSGLSIGLILPLVIALISEFAPNKLRSFFLSSLWTGTNVGVLYVLAVTTSILPDFGQRMNDLPKILILCTLPSLICVFLVINYIHESPRTLILKGKHKEAYKYLEKIQGRSLTKEEKMKLKREGKKGGSNKIFEDSGIASLFLPYIFTETILNIVVCFAIGFTIGIPMLIQSLTIKELDGEDENLNQLIPKLWIFHLIHFPANMIGGALTEVQIFGRKLTLSITLFTPGVLTIISFFFPQNFEVFLGLELLFLYAAQSVFMTYLCEVYPTKIRTTAQGFFSGLSYASILCSQFIAVGLHYSHVYAPYILSVFISFLGGLSAIFLPFETSGKPIDILLDDVSPVSPKLTTIKEEKDEKMLIDQTSELDSFILEDTQENENEKGTEVNPLS